MTSNMLAGERRWASARRGGMTVLGKVAVPKPLNLPSQKLENHGLDPNVEIVPKGSLSWGSRPSSSTSNPWGSAISPRADGTTGSPSHLSGRPSSGGGLSRPSTAGSDRVHEPATSNWGPNSRPSSASGVLTSNQSSATVSRPLSADTRPGSSHLSRFAEPAFDNSVAWGPSGTAEKLMSSKNNDFSLSSGDFPTLGSEKDNATKSSESNGDGSHVRPSSASGRTAPAKDRNTTSHADLKSGTTDSWRRDGPPHAEDGTRPNHEKWQGETQQYVNPSVPQHFDAWRGPPMNAPGGGWYRGPPGGPPYPPIAHGGFPMEPFPYYRPQIPPALANPQSGPMAGAGPRGHHPKNGDFYRPQMPDAFIRPGMPIRPGFYPGPVPYDGYYGPPMGYNANERDFSFMGMQPGPPVYNMYPAQNTSEPNDAHFRAGGHGSTSQQLDSVRPEESRGPYKVLRKHENEWDADVEEENWEHNTAAHSSSLEKSDQPRSSFHKNEQGTDTLKNEYMRSRRNRFVENPSSKILSSRGYPSDSVIVHSHEGTHKPKASDDSWGKKSEIGARSFPEVPQEFPAKMKDSSLIQKIEGLNAKVRTSDVREGAQSGSSKEEQKNILLVNSKDNSTIEVGSTYSAGNLGPPSHDLNVLTGDNTFKSTTTKGPQFSRRVHHGVQSRADHHNKGRVTNQDADGWRKKPPNLGSEPAAAVPHQHVDHTTTFQVPDHHISAEAAEKSESKDSGESLNSMVDPIDGQAQRAKMRELAKLRAIQLQKEEEERIREQKAKALAKLEELNRRTLAADGTTQNAEKTVSSVPVQQDVDGSQRLTESVIVASKHEELPSGLDTKSLAVAQSSTSRVGQSTALPRDSNAYPTRNDQQEPVVSHGHVQSLLQKQSVVNSTDVESKDVPLVSDGSLPRQKRTSQRQKQSVQVDKSLTEKSAPSGTGEMLRGHAGAVIQNPGTNVAVSGEAVPSPESSLPTNLNPEPTHQRRRNNRSNKNKHKLDEASAPATASLSSSSREGDLAKVISEGGRSESPELERDSSTVLVTDGKDAIQSNLEQNSSLPHGEAHGRAINQYKPQHSRRMPRNPQANRSADKFHGSDAVMWAPVRVQNKAEPGDETNQRAVQDDVSRPATNINSVQTNLKNKRAEMERYVPKPVAKELAQQPATQTLPGKSTSEDATDREELVSEAAIAAPVNVESKSSDMKQNKQGKSHGAWHQLDQGFQQGSSLTSSSNKSQHKVMSQHEASNPVPTETNFAHEWDPSDGWYMPEDPPTEVAPVTSAVKDGVRGKGKKPTFKGQRSRIHNHDVDHKNANSVEAEKTFIQSNQTDRPTSSKENRSSQWQPKSQAHTGGRPNQNASSEGKKDHHTPQVQPEEPVADYKSGRHQEGRRERKSTSFRGHPHSSNQRMEDEAPFEQQHFRKSGGQNNRSNVQDNRQQNNPTANGERQRQNTFHQYQQVGSNSGGKFNNFDAPAADGSRYKERGSGQSRRGGSNSYGRSSGAV